LIITFTDQSTNKPTSWQWDFGDGGTSAQPNPTHTFRSTNGSQTVTLSVANAYGADAKTKTTIINIGKACSHRKYTDPRDGKIYAVADIGNQTWMTQNLNYVTENSWTYNNDPANGDAYGRLYTWEAARAACPRGWRLPSDEDWRTLEIALGMSKSEAIDDGWCGDDQGKQMKSINGWHNDGNGTDSSGFNALPGGYRYSSGSFDNLGAYGYWWSSTKYRDSRDWFLRLHYDHDQVGRYHYNKAFGFSVRCIKD